MAYSYQNFTGTGAQTTFTFTNIDGFLSTSNIYVYVDSVLKTAGTHYNINGTAKTITFTAGNIPAAGTNIKVKRVTPKGVADRPVDFTDGSVLTASDLDNSALQLLYIAQEAADDGDAAMGPTQTGTAWDAGAKRLTNVSNPLESQDAVTKVYVDQLALYGGVSSNPQSWTLTAVNAQQQYTLPAPAPLNLNKEFFIVMVGGVVQPTDNYSFSVSGTNYYLNFPATVAAAIDVPGSGTVKIIIRNFGTTRVANTGSVGTDSLANNAVTSVKLAAGAVDTTALGTAAVTTANLATGAVDSTKLAAGAVDTTALGSLAVTAAKIAVGAVDSTKLASGAAATNIGYTPVNSTGGTMSGNLNVPDITVASATTAAANANSVRAYVTSNAGYPIQSTTTISANTTIDLASLSVGKSYIYRITAGSFLIQNTTTSGTFLINGAGTFALSESGPVSGVVVGQSGHVGRASATTGSIITSFSAASQLVLSTGSICIIRIA